MSNVEVPATSDLSAVSQNERLTPIMQTADIEGLAEFYERIGFTVTYRQSRPYEYLAVQWRSVELHFGRRPSAAVDDSEDCACLGSCRPRRQLPRGVPQLAQGVVGSRPDDWTSPADPFPAWRKPVHAR